MEFRKTSDVPAKIFAVFLGNEVYQGIVAWGVWGGGGWGFGKAAEREASCERIKRILFFYILNNTKQVATGQDMLHYTVSFLYSVSKKLRLGRTWPYTGVLISL